MTISEAFDQAMRETVQRSKSECGYNPQAFVTMLAMRGGVRAAKDLLAKGVPSEGFATLWEKKRLDLTVEAVVLQERFAPLFTLAERQTAWERLRAHGWSGLPARPEAAPAEVGAPGSVTAVSAQAVESSAAALLRRLTPHVFPIPPVGATDGENEQRRWQTVPRGHEVRQLPGIGVYVFLAGEEVLYVGSAVTENLVGRALDYLWKEGNRKELRGVIRQRADRLALIFTKTKAAARLLEADLITRLNPTLNEDMNWGEGEAALEEYRSLVDGV
jgi:hypothetical protein